MGLSTVVLRLAAILRDRIWCMRTPKFEFRTEFKIPTSRQAVPDAIGTTRGASRPPTLATGTISISQLDNVVQNGLSLPSENGTQSTVTEIHRSEGSARKKAKKTKVWEFFEMIEAHGDKIAQSSKKCLKRYKNPQGASTLTRHARTHVSRTEGATQDTFSTSGDLDKSIFSKRDQETTKSQLIRWMVGITTPFSTEMNRTLGFPSA